jgi:hypothetical protein
VLTKGNSRLNSDCGDYASTEGGMGTYLPISFIEMWTRSKRTEISSQKTGVDSFFQMESRTSSSSISSKQKDCLLISVQLVMNNEVRDKCGSLNSKTLSFEKVIWSRKKFWINQIVSISNGHLVWICCSDFRLNFFVFQMFWFYFVNPLNWKGRKLLHLAYKLMHLKNKLFS